jgi:hypothetical protein
MGGPAGGLAFPPPDANGGRTPKLLPTRWLAREDQNVSANRVVSARSSARLVPFVAPPSNCVTS